MKNLLFLTPPIKAALPGAALLLSVIFGTAYAKDTTNGAAPSPAMETTRIVLPLTAPNGIKINELSALAWDEDEKLFYALSDKGKIFQFEVTLKQGSAPRVEVKYAAHLSADGQPLKLNAEGLALSNGHNGRTGDTELVVAGEGSPYFSRFTPQGVLKQKFPVPASLANPANFKSANRGLEAVGIHPQYGILTAPESPLKNAPAKMHTIYASQRTWQFPRYAEKSRLKEMVVLPDGNLMVLERTRDHATMLYTASLRYVDLQNCPANGICKTEDRAVLPASAENFEGLAYLGDKRYLLANDNGKNKESSELLLLTLH